MPESELPNRLPVKIPARSPFNDADADIIFRSSDDVDFRLYKVILAKASPVLRTMLDLPQPSSHTSSTPDQPHVVKLSEDAKTLENVFRLCYPVEHPRVTSLDDVHPILEAARKYDMACVAANLRCVITPFLSKEPLRVYAIAYMLQMEDVAGEAAGLFLEMPQFHIPSPVPPEFSSLPCLAMYAVHVYRQKCADAALRALADQEWIYHGPHEHALVYPNGERSSVPDRSQSWIWIACGYQHTPSGTIRIEGRGFHVPKWYEVYIDALKVALTERPSARTALSFLGSTRASEAVSQAELCSSCVLKVHAHLTRFNELLAERVDNALAKIKIELPFSTASKQ